MKVSDAVPSLLTTEQSGPHTGSMTASSQGSANQGGRVRAAIFVDFDNVYIGLKALDPGAAERFATDPGQWLDAITEADESGGKNVRFLIRNCYLNPTVYAKYRTFWTRAGFRVIDCPSLTQQGKSSTDINLVLDAVDVLAGVAHIEEFFIASDDADFTSLVQRFRAADRRTTVIVAGPVAAAYRQMADTIIQSHDFLALLSGADNSAIAVAQNRLPAKEASTAAKKSPAISTAAAVVRDYVTTAAGPIKAAVVAQRALTADSSLSTDWDGHGKFGAWITRVDDRIEFAPVPAPGWVWDSDRFSQTDLPSETESTEAFEKQIARVTDIPALSSAQYRQVLVSLAAKLNETTVRSELAKLVRDECLAADVPVARSSVNYVIQGLTYAKGALSAELTETQLAEAWTGHVEGMCRVAGLQLDKGEVAKLRAWTSGGLLKKARQAG